MQREARVLATKAQDSPSVWVIKAPEFITVYGKPNMNAARRQEWILWRAAKLELELTNTVFMAVFKQVTFFSDDISRLKQFKIAVAAY